MIYFSFKHLSLVLLLGVLFSHSVFAIEDTTHVNGVAMDASIKTSLYSTALLDAMSQDELFSTTDDEFSPMPQIAQSMMLKRDSVIGAMNMFSTHGNYADEFPDKISMLPLGIRKTIGNVKYTLMLTSVTASSDVALLSAYLKVELTPERVMYFGVENVRLNSNGGISDMKLTLLGAVVIPMGAYKLTLMGAMDKLTGLSTVNSTYAIVGCQGLKLVNLVGEFEFSNKVIIPVDKQQTNVKAPFAISAKDFNDMVVQLSLPEFEMKGLKDVEFKVSNAVLDLSDTRNAPGMTFPAGYQNKYYSGNSLLWRGVYIGQLAIKLPHQFAKKGGGDRPSFSGTNMIIDAQGVSGSYAVQANILTINEGSASGWKFSVNKVYLDLEANKVTKGGFGGDLILPVSTKKGSEATPLAYQALITDQDEYLLTVALKDTMEFGLFSADIFLLPNSYVNLNLVTDENGNKKFKPVAVLTGDMIIATKFAAKISFTELRLMTDAPYVGVKGVTYTSQNKVSSFPVSISSLGIRETIISGQDCLEMQVTIAINLEKGKINGATSVSLSGYYDRPSGDGTEGKWKFYKFRVNMIHLEAKFGAMKVNGTIIFMNDDPLYGDGFYGDVTVTYNEKLTIASTAMFGAKDFRYWYFYARINLPTAITVVGPFMVDGFGGGAYSKMSLAPKGSLMPYVPDEKTGFGVKALVGYVIAKKEVCHGDLMFEINFNSTGGVRYIAFYGSAEILSGSQQLADISSKLDAADNKVLAATDKALGDQMASGNVQAVASKSQVSKKPASSIFAYIGINYNFETSTLEANSEIFISLGILKGRGPNNRAGWMALHVSPERWYCYAGTPEDRLGITLNMKVLTLSTGSYFMVGSEMPTFPDPPAEVVRILGPDLYPAKNNLSESSLKTGAGFAFGLDLSLSTHVDFYILYANMQAGVGADIMLRQYPDAHCEGSTAELGINNWYANGRVYTYLEGEIGVKVDLFFIHARIPIINGAAAAMLEGGGPNPTWAKGYLRVRFSVLGGKISGDMNMKMSLGDECKIVNNTNAPVNFKIISDISPANTSTEIDVFTSPQIAFNVGVNEAFEINDDNGTKLFRVKITSLSLSKANEQLAFEQKFSNKNQTLTLTPENTLPSESSVELKIKVEFEVFENSNWQAYKVNGAAPSEIQVVSFKTSKAPTDIPHRNIAFMFPVHKQKNLYRNESPKGYVVLKQWQAYLFEEDKDNVQLIKITTGEEGAASSTMITPALVRADKKIEFDITSLQSQKSYTIELISRPKAQKTASADSVSNSYGDKENGQYNVTENKATAQVKNDGDKLLLTYSFATSQYDRLSDKITAINSGISNKLIYLSNSDYLNVRTRNYEVFDSTELFGSVYTADQPLLTYQSLLTDSYYQTDVFNKIYKDYPYPKASKITIRERDVTEYGFPPVRALYHDPEYELDVRRMPYIDGQTDVYRKDYKDIEDQMVDQWVRGNTPLLSSYPQFFSGRFPEPSLNNQEQIQFNYVMPGSKIGSSAVINYKR